jgi:hypothetical protein
MQTGNVSHNFKTISGWVRYNGIQSLGSSDDYGPIFFLQGDDEIGGYYKHNFLRLDGADPASAHFKWSPGPMESVPGSVTGSVVVGDGVWRHVAVTVSGTTHTLYVDGAVDSSATISNSLTGAYLYHYMGSKQIPSESASYLNGDLGTFQFYTSALTPTEILQNCWAQKNRYSGASCAAP